MKKILTPVVTVLILSVAITTLKAQSARYAPAMQANLEQLSQAKNTHDYISVSAAFERIAKAEKTLWIPYYYAALAKLNGAMRDENVDKDQFADQIDSLLSAAERIEKNSELTTLHYYNEVLKMTVNPAARYMDAAAVMRRYFQTAVAEDSTNPRIYFLEGQTVFHTPESFGGGPAAAKALFQKSVDLFELEQKDTARNFLPKWGKEPAAAMLEKCQQ